MFKTKNVVFHTSAGVEDARRLLQAQTLPGASSADDLVDMVKDTLSTDKTPFRGEIEGTRFKLTRRVRGRRVRIQLAGTLEPKPDGSTDIRASMSPPRSLIASLVASFVALLILTGGFAAAGAPLWVPLLVLLGLLPVAGLSSHLYEAETSRTFSALRDAIPEHPLPAIAPVGEGDVEKPDASRVRE